MKKFKIIFINLFLILLHSNSCKNKDCTKDGSCPEEYYRFTLGEAKSYIWAKPGSYWIYKNTVNGHLDTQTVTGLVLDTFIIKGTKDYSQHRTVEFDKLLRFIYSSYHKEDYYDITVDPQPNGTSFNGNYRIIIDRHGAGLFVPFFSPFQIDAWSGTGSTDTYCKKLDSSINIQGKTYFQVAKFEISDELTWSNVPPFSSCEYYWAKDVGLIKMSVAKSIPENWELIEYNIIQ